MKTFSALFLLAIASAIAQSPPNIPSSFSTDFTDVYFDYHRQTNQTFCGTRYVDATNLYVREDMTFNDGFAVTRWAFFNNHTEYQYATNGSVCFPHHFPGQFQDEFGWVAQAKSTGSCTVDSTDGQSWTVNPTPESAMTLCANGNVPLDQTFKDHFNGEMSTYTNFVGGAPNPSVFLLPPQCFHG